MRHDAVDGAGHGAVLLGGSGVRVPQGGGAQVVRDGARRALPRAPPVARPPPPPAVRALVHQARAPHRPLPRVPAARHGLGKTLKDVQESVIYRVSFSQGSSVKKIPGKWKQDKTMFDSDHPIWAQPRMNKCDTRVQDLDFRL